MVYFMKLMKTNIYIYIKYDYIHIYYDVGMDALIFELSYELIQSFFHYAR